MYIPVFRGDSIFDVNIAGKTYPCVAEEILPGIPGSPLILHECSGDVEAKSIYSHENCVSPCMKLVLSTVFLCAARCVVHGRV